MSKLKAAVALLIATLFIAVTGIPATAAAAVAGTETYLFHSYINNGTAATSDTTTLRFMGAEASFDYDISTVPVGTEIEFKLELTAAKPLTVGMGCCVQGGIDGTWEQSGVSFGGGVWSHTKADGEKVANLKIFNRYDEFLDGKYKGLFGKVTAKTSVKIGDAEPIALSSANASKFKLNFEFATYAKSYKVPKNLSQLWLETMWSPKGKIAKGTTLTYSDPKITIKSAKTKKSSTFKIVNHGFSLSLAAYNDATSYYQEGVGTKLNVTQDGATISIGQGIYLPISTPVGSQITVSPFKVTR